MDRSIFTSLLFLVLFAAAVSADIVPEEYWKEVLPDTPIPRIVRDLLHKDAHVKDGKRALRVTRFLGYIYRYASKTPVHVDPTVALFFLEKDLHPDAKMKLDFLRNAPVSAFIPRSVSDSIPFSSDKLPEILTRFSIKAGNSVEVEDARQTLQLCETPTTEGETKFCATSLESMIDFATSSLGTHSVWAASMDFDKEGEALKQQFYTVASPAVENLGMGGKTVVCHHLPYPCALFYCHTMKSAIKTYVVPLVGEDGSKVAALAICHMDTSAWNPSYPAFQLLKVKPGTVPICHFLHMDAIVWVPSK